MGLSQNAKYILINIVILMNVGESGNHFLMIHMHAPIRHKGVKGISVPWITPGIKCMMRNRDYHNEYAIKHDSRLHWEKFQLLRNKVNIEIRNAKSKCFHD